MALHDYCASAFARAWRPGTSDFLAHYALRVWSWVRELRSKGALGGELDAFGRTVGELNRTCHMSVWGSGRSFGV